MNIVGLIRNHGVTLRETRAGHLGRCPFCGGDRGLAVNEARGIYHCFACGESGDAVRFVMKMDNCSHAVALAKVRNAEGADRC